jgi:hypothetical protein
MSVIGARVSVGVMTEGGPSLVAFGSIGTAYLVGRSWYRNRQGTHWFELQQTRAAFRTHLQPGCWSMPDLAGELQSHFPSVGDQEKCRDLITNCAEVRGPAI